MENKNSYLVPGAIVAAGLIIAGAVFYSGGDSSRQSDTSAQAFRNTNSPVAENIRPVDENDHILGDPSAPVVIVEFSDLECPFCKRFHETMKQVLEKYGESGQVAWVYRHFPLDSIHSKARKEAEATECAQELGGTLAFWEYTNGIFQITPSNNRLDLSLLPQIAEDIGLDRQKFEECLQSGKYAKHVEADYQDALNAGARGTPYSVIITKNGEVFPFSGALPFEQIQSLIEQALEAE